MSMFRQRKMPAKLEEAVKAVEQGLDYAASEVYTDEEERIVAAARAGLRVLQRAAIPVPAKESAMTDRADYVASMTPDERTAALARLGVLHPGVFDELREDTEHQREIRLRRERGDGSEEESGADD